MRRDLIANGPTKGAKAATVEGPTWSIALTGTVAGACGLSQASLSGYITPVLSAGTKAKPRRVAATFVDLWYKAVISGTTDKGETFVGEFQYIPDPTQGSCANKGAKVFHHMGTLAIVP